MRRYAAFLSLVVVAGCDEDIRTEHYGLDLDDFAGNPVGSSLPVIAGTKLCSSGLSCHADCPYGSDAPCASLTQEVVGVAKDGDGCYTLGSGQSLTWTFTPNECTTPQPSESLMIETVELDQVTAELSLPRLRDLQDLADQYDVAWAPAGAPSPGSSEYAGSVGVFAGEFVGVTPVLVEASSGRRVGYNASELAVTVVPSSGAAPQMDPVLSPLAVTAEAGSRFVPTLAFAERSWSTAEFVAVGEDAPAEIALSALVLADVTFVVEAIVRDRDGRILLGTPISWTDRSGEFVIASDTGLTERQRDMAGVADDCVAPSQRGRTRHVIVEASYRELSATLELDLDGEALVALDEQPLTDDEWVKPVECYEVIDDGCGCRSGDGALGLLLGVPWLVRRRRRVTGRG